MSEKEEFCLSVQSEMTPDRDIFDTVSMPIPHGKTLHLKSLDVSCSPSAFFFCQSEKHPGWFGNRNILRVDLLWREGTGDTVFDHPVDSPVWTENAESHLYELSRCLDGEEMKSDGTGRLVIRRTVAGVIGAQCTAVVARGHY